MRFYYKSIKFVMFNFNVEIFDKNFIINIEIVLFLSKVITTSFFDRLIRYKKCVKYRI